MNIQFEEVQILNCMINNKSILRSTVEHQRQRKASKEHEENLKIKSQTSHLKDVRGIMYELK